MSCPDCNEAVLEACRRPSLELLKNQSPQRSIDPSFLLHCHCAPRLQSRRLRLSLCDEDRVVAAFDKYELPIPIRSENQ